jgi:hypothetical protein
MWRRLAQFLGLIVLVMAVGAGLSHLHLNSLGDLVFLLLGWILTFILVYARHNRGLGRLGRCPTCGYDLHRSKARCPECGKLIPPGARH